MNQNTDKLPDDAKDIIQAIFDYHVPAAFGISPDAIEVKLDNPVFNLLEGNGTVHYHALGNTENYLHHCKNNEWAIIFDGSQIGNAENGKKLINSGKDVIIS
ncbi:hypothetical protein LCGC14_0842550 [marine sediment metagenome]|uniref:Uncharacterized protein n=1 Tax=marine sediment metagenome TaxID=412755 RepID=A0A0F9PXV6_9ZZZZ